MNRPKLQHYVTRAYLDGFLAEKEKTLHVYSRGSASTFRAKPENLAAIKNYYSTKHDDGTYDDRIEKMFADQVEGPGMRVIRKLAKGQHQLSRPSRAQLSMLLAIQEYRVPWMREAMERFTTAMLVRFTKAMTNAPGLMEKTIEELSLAPAGQETKVAEEMRAVLQTGDIRITASPGASMQAMGHLLNSLPNVYYAMSWDVLEAPSATFITSDCPVHRYYLPVRGDIPPRGLMDPRVQVRFPLSRERMLVLRHDRKRMEMIEVLRRRRGNRAAQQMADIASTIRYAKIGQSAVAAINKHTAAMAQRFIFSDAALPNGPDLVSGDCRNVRHEFIDLPDGSTEFRSVYPAQ